MSLPTPHEEQSKYDCPDHLYSTSLQSCAVRYKKEIKNPDCKGRSQTLSAVFIFDIENAMDLQISQWT